MTFELFRFANLVAAMHFVTDSDYDSCIGEIKVTNESNTYLYWETFHGSEERNSRMAEALRVCANEMENF